MHCSWFRNQDTRGIYAYNAAANATNIPVISDQFARILLDECCKGAADIWDRKGTLTIPGMFNWLETGITVNDHHEPGVKPLIDHEWQMYLHHQCRINDQSNLGWLRNMLYSVTQ